MSLSFSISLTNPKTIEALIESARTGNLASFVRTISITYVQLFVPGYSLQIPW